MHGRNYVSALGNLTPFTSFWEEIVIIMFMISSVPIFYLNYLISIKSLKFFFFEISLTFSMLLIWNLC